ncbi:hypothetical protein AB0G71_16075 [Streptomyces sp. NPDC020403]|uniref:hypothetical protein n=1 Tax=unclassified Streptomyces TaxID=2593676 RepID=UPI0033DC512F
MNVMWHPQLASVMVACVLAGPLFWYGIRHATTLQSLIVRCAVTGLSAFLVSTLFNGIFAHLMAYPDDRFPADTRFIAADPNKLRLAVGDSEDEVRTFTQIHLCESASAKGGETSWICFHDDGRRTTSFRTRDGSVVFIRRWNDGK